MTGLTTNLLAIALAGQSAPPADASAERSASAPTEEQSPRVPTGVFSYVGDEEEWTRIKEEIAQATEELLIGQIVARQKLEDILRPSPRLRLANDGETFVVEGRRGRIEAPLGGRGQYRAPDGSKFTVFHRARPDALDQVLKNDDGSTRKISRIDGDTLKVWVKIHDRRIPGDIVYTITYRRGD